MVNGRVKNGFFLDANGMPIQKGFLYSDGLNKEYLNGKYELSKVLYFSGETINNFTPILENPFFHADGKFPAPEEMDGQLAKIPRPMLVKRKNDLKKNEEDSELVNWLEEKLKIK